MNYWLDVIRREKQWSKIKDEVLYELGSDMEFEYCPFQNNFGFSFMGEPKTWIQIGVSRRNIAEKQDIIAEYLNYKYRYNVVMLEGLHSDVIDSTKFEYKNHCIIITGKYNFTIPTPATSEEIAKKINDNVKNS